MEVSLAPLQEARVAELRGDFAHAAALFGEAGEWDDAARVTLLQGDASTDPAAQLRLYTKAVAIAPMGGPVAADARRKRALAVLALGEGTALTRALRLELVQAARQLEGEEDYQHAAEAYARADDFEGQARALARAGAVDALEFVLTADLARRRDERNARDAEADFATLVRSGSRREALALAQARGNERLRENGRALEERSLRGNVLHARVRDRAIHVVLGEEIVVGRAPAEPGDTRVGTLAVPSRALSRDHVSIFRRGDGVFVRDRESRNGTTVHGKRLDGETPVGQALELWLGRTVRLLVRLSEEWPPAVAIDIGGVSYFAPLGAAAPLGIGHWRLERDPDGWIELATDDAPPGFADALRLGCRVALLAGDAIGTTREGPPEFVVDR